MGRPRRARPVRAPTTSKPRHSSWNHDSRGGAISIGERTGTAPILAGSGATWFVEGEHGNALADLVDEGATVVVARTVPMDVATERS